MDVNEFRNRLVALLSSSSDIHGIGQTGDLHAPLIPGKSDIDLFVLCERIPSREERLLLYEPLTAVCESVQMEVCSGGIWGCGDIFLCEGIDVMPMYFTCEEMESYVCEVLAGKHLEKEGRFYPIGRLASIETLNVLFEEKGVWTAIIERVREHPQELFSRWYASEISQMIDEEDLGRALLRKDVLFYHQVVEEFLDHFLQALYARNGCYFPSRKRNGDAIRSFRFKPESCLERLGRIIALGASSETIGASVSELRSLGEELKRL